MDIEKWFKNKGSYSQGVALYAALPRHNKTLLQKLATESPANLLKLKYELKMAMGSGQKATVTPVVAKPVPVPAEKPDNKPAEQVLIKQAVDGFFAKETMAMYPAELHTVYRDRVNCFYQACELKFKLNRLRPDQEQEALELILQLDALWQKIDRYWDMLNHWKEHKRIMPVAESEDFTQLSADKLMLRRKLLDTNLSKRRKTIAALEATVQASPEDRTKLNLLNRKKEQLQQLINDLESIRKALKEKG